MSVDGWAMLAVLSMVAALLLLLVYLFIDNMLMRKVGFFGSIVFFAVFLFSNLFAFQQKRELENRRGAVVIVPSVSVKKTPAQNSSDEFVIHEGTRVMIADDTMKEWKAIRLDDGKEGWVMTKQIEKI